MVALAQPRPARPRHAILQWTRHPCLVAAIFFARRTATRQNAFHERMVALADARERDRLLAGPEVRASIQREASHWRESRLACKVLGSLSETRERSRPEMSACFSTENRHSSILSFRAVKMKHDSWPGWGSSVHSRSNDGRRQGSRRLHRVAKATCGIRRASRKNVSAFRMGRYFYNTCPPPQCNRSKTSLGLPVQSVVAEAESSIYFVLAAKRGIVANSLGMGFKENADIPP